MALTRISAAEGDLEDPREGMGEGRRKFLGEELRARISQEEGDRNILGEGQGLTSELDADSIVGITY